jgi:hypothetical protein
MAAIKQLEHSADKWTRRAGVAGPDYQAGVSNPRSPWAAAASAADGIYRQAVTAAANAGRYQAGIRRAGDERWRTNAMAKGPGRFAEGVQLAQGEWQRGFAPYQSAVSALQLPARGPAGSPANLQRVAAVAQALRAVKERAGGGGQTR